MKKKILLFITSVLFACTNVKDVGGIISNNERKLYGNNFTFVQNDIKEFYLDDETINLIDYVQYINLDSMKFLSILNKYNN